MKVKLAIPEPSPEARSLASAAGVLLDLPLAGPLGVRPVARPAAPPAPPLEPPPATRGGGAGRGGGGPAGPWGRGAGWVPPGRPAGAPPGPGRGARSR